MTCHEKNRRTPRPDDTEAGAGKTWPRHRKGDSFADTLQRNKEWFNVVDLFDVVESAISGQIGHPLRRKVERVGVWHHVTVNRQRINYIGVDVARAFPGEVGIVVFPAAVDFVGEDAIHQLRCRYDWRLGEEHYQTAHTLFLIPSLDYWERRQGDFVKLTADINAATGR